MVSRIVMRASTMENGIGTKESEISSSVLSEDVMAWNFLERLVVKIQDVRALLDGTSRG